MTKRKYSEVEMIGALKQMEAGRSAADVGRELGVSKHTIYSWKAKYGGMTVGEAQRLRELEDENGRLKKLVAESEPGQADAEGAQTSYDSVRRVRGQITGRDIHERSNGWFGYRQAVLSGSRSGCQRSSTRSCSGRSARLDLSSRYTGCRSRLMVW